MRIQTGQPATNVSSAREGRRAEMRFALNSNLEIAIRWKKSMLDPDKIHEAFGRRYLQPAEWEAGKQLIMQRAKDARSRALHDLFARSWSAVRALSACTVTAAARLAVAVLAAVALLSSPVITVAQETATDGARPAQRVSTICAHRHVRLVTLIEDFGEHPEFAGDKLFKAMLATMHAHDVCAQGNEYEALSLYDRAVLDLVFPVASLR
jgi:hypothetical protein